MRLAPVRLVMSPSMVAAHACDMWPFYEPRTGLGGIARLRRRVGFLPPDSGNMFEANRLAVSYVNGLESYMSLHSAGGRLGFDAGYRSHRA